MSLRLPDDRNQNGEANRDRTHSDMYFLPSQQLLNEETVRGLDDDGYSVYQRSRARLLRGYGFDHSGSRMVGSPNDSRPESGVNNAAGTSTEIEMEPAAANSNEAARRYPLSYYKSYKCEAMFFPDGQRRVDYVFAYSPEDESNSDRKDSADAESSGDSKDAKVNGKAKKRELYEKNLEKLGLELQHVEGKNFVTKLLNCLPDSSRRKSYCHNTKFVLVHAPFDLLLKQAETLSVKMPVLESDVKLTADLVFGLRFTVQLSGRADVFHRLRRIKERTIIEGVLDRFLKRFPFFTFDAGTNERLKEPNYFTAPFVAAHLNCYVGSDNADTFFDGSERSRMVYDLLIRTRYDDGEDDNTHRIGISRLLQNGVYTAAYPLHEECESLTYNVKDCSNREMLYWNWARISNFYKYQPLTLIKKYFGSKLGIYFAWLGYYTKVLMPAAFIGFICFLFGVLTFTSDTPSNEICAKDNIGAQAVMCPTCDQYCDFIQLKSSCLYAKLSYIFDNYATVVFAALMSIGATLFIEGWKRYHAEIAWKWGLLDFELDEETIRPEYQMKVKAMKTTRLNPVSQTLEPYMPMKSRIFRFLGSGVTVLFFLLLVIAFVVGITIYRIVLVQVLYRADGMQSYATLVTFSTAAVLNLIVILLMSYFYTYLAYKLTEWECPRTQAQFDSSYTFKVFLFQFINYYSSIFYIAFIKGNLSGVPGQRRISDFRLEECDPAGCMVELVIQLAIIMCGKQFFSAFMEIAFPVVMNVIRAWRYAIGETEAQKSERLEAEKKEQIKNSKEDVPRYERDYVLNPTYDQFLFDEYLEMVIQFGFVTLFVPAFPLAPLFALLNNVVEIRMDAYKFTITSRKPVPERAKDIGMWLPILDGISNAAVLVNAFIIAFTSDFIPKLVYMVENKEHNHDLTGYINNSLSYFDATNVSSTVKWSGFEDQNITACRYRDYRKPPCTLFPNSDCDYEYSWTTEFWIVLTFRLTFVLIFIHVVGAIKAFVSYIIPDIPSRIFVQLQRQRFLSRQARLSNMTSNQPDFPVDNKPPLTRRSRMTSADRKEVAFQPGLFSNEDERIGSKLKTVLKETFGKRPSTVVPSMEA